MHLLQNANNSNVSKYQKVLKTTNESSNDSNLNVRNARMTRNKTTSSTHMTTTSTSGGITTTQSMDTSDTISTSKHNSSVDHVQSANIFLTTCNNIYQKYTSNQLEISSNNGNNNTNHAAIPTVTSSNRKRPSTAITNSTSSSLYINNSIPSFYHNAIQLRLDESSCRSDMITILSDLKQHSNPTIMAPAINTIDRDVLCKVVLLSNHSIQIQEDVYIVGEYIDILYVNTNEWHKHVLITTVTAYELIVKLSNNVRVSVFIKNIIHHRVIIYKTISNDV